MLVNREVILAKLEGPSNYGVDASPTTTDAILIENVSWSHEGARMVDRPAIRQSLGSLKQIFGGTLMAVSFECEIRGAGAAYSASVKPEVDALLQACGMTVAIDATVSNEKATYTPASTGHDSATIYYYQDGLLTKLTGCRGTVSFNMEVGGRLMGSFNFTGHTSTPTDVGLVTPSYDSTVAPIAINGAFSIGGYSAVINSLGFDLGNSIATPPDLSASDGYGEIYITKREVTGSIDPEAVLVATNSFVADWRSGAEMALTTGVIGAVQYNRFKVDMPKVYYKDVGQGDRDNVRTYALGLGAVENSGDDEVSIEFS